MALFLLHKKFRIFYMTNFNKERKKKNMKKAMIITKRQSWMLPDLSVQRKTPNGPKLKSLTYCVICYIMYIS